MTTIDPILPMKTEVRNTDAVANALTKGVSNLKPSLGLKALLATDSVKARFESVLKAKSAGFMSSLLSLHSSNPSLAQCAPMAVIQAAAVAASLDLPINPSLGFAYIVPYKNKGVMEPQFQIGAKGFVQLAIRSGQYQTMNVTEVYEGEIETTNRITGEFVFNATGKKSDKVVGYAAYLKLLNGFEKYLYMTTEQAEAHGKKFSKSYAYDSSPWKKDFPSMAKKTVLKLLLSKWGILSVDMQKAMVSDQGIVKADETVEFADNATAVEGEIVEEVA